MSRPIHHRDVLALAGGWAVERYGTPTWRASTPQRGEGYGLAVTRAAGTTTRWQRNKVLVESVPANQPRISWVDADGDGVMDTCILLVEPARTNLLLQSEDIGAASWTKTRTTASTNTTASPRGGTDADALVEDSTASSTHLCSQVVTGTADGTYGMSVFVKANTRTWCRLVLVDNVTASNFCAAYFNSSDGSVGTTNAGGTGAFARTYVERIGDWYRIGLVGSVGNSVTAIRCECRLATANGTDSYSGDGTSSLFVWGFQFEDVSPCITSYIPTAGATLTRNQDDLVDTYFGSAVDCTLFAKFIELGTAFTGGSPRILQVGSTVRSALIMDGSADYRIRINHGSDTASSIATTEDPSLMDTVELLAPVFADGSVQITQALNGGTPVTASQSAGITVQDKTETTIFYGGIPSVVGSTGIIAAGVLRGTGYTMDDMRRYLAA